MNLKKLYQKPFYPLLLAVYPILFLYTCNISTGISFSGPFKFICISILATAFLMAISYLILKSWTKSALIVSVFIAAFFSYGIIYFKVNTPGSSFYLRHRYFFPVCMLFLFIIFILVKKVKKISPAITKYLNAFSSALLFIQFFLIVQYYFNSIDKDIRVQVETIKINKENAKKPLRDIYFIIVDAYAPADILNSLYGFDGRPFQKWIKEHGFYTISQISSNYSVTRFAIPAYLNMNYIQTLLDCSNEFPNDRMSDLSHLVKQNLIFSFLKKRGYYCINIASGYCFTHYINYADKNIEVSIRDFTYKLSRSTMLCIVDDIFPDIIMRQRVTRQFEMLKKIPDMPEKNKFVFCHIVSPHEPYIFNRNGANANTHQGHEKQYIDQWVYINKKLAETVSEILRKSIIKPIIVIQTDHGSRTSLPLSWRKRLKSQSLISISNKNKLESLCGFSALYLPDGGNKIFSTTTTPVNIFRKIFNYYFGSQFIELENKNYFCINDDTRGTISLKDCTSLVDEFYHAGEKSILTCDNKLQEKSRKINKKLGCK